MFLLILGILLLIGGFVVSRRTDYIQRYSIPLRLGGLLIAVIGLFSACLVQIGAGEVGVKTLYGNVQNDVLGSD